MPVSSDKDTSMTEDESLGGGSDPGPDADPATRGGVRPTPEPGPALGHRHRPPAVTVVAVTYLVLSVAWAAITIRVLISAHILLPPGGGVLDMESLRSGFTLLGGIVAVRQAAVGVTAFVGGIALLRMQPRGWLLGMFAAIIRLPLQPVSWYDTTPNYVLMAFAVAIVLLMNQTEVRDVFGEEPTA